MKRWPTGYPIFACASVAIFLLTILPFPATGSPTDGPDHSKFTNNDCIECHPSKAIVESALRSSAQSPHVDMLCTTCHAPHGSNNLRNIYEELETTNSGVRSVLFLNFTGPNSYADGDSVYDGVCEVCHTATAYHRNNPSGNHTHNAATNCATCHEHYNAWQAEDCKACHNTTQPFQAGDYRRQVVENTGDGGGDFVRASHHVTDGTESEIVTAGDCAVCHDQSNHQSYTDGVSVYLNDPAGGAPIFYDGEADSLERFCSACHDGTHLSPFSSGLPAPELPSGWATAPHKQAGATCYGDGSPTGCHANAHGSDYVALLQARYTLNDYEPFSTAAYEVCWLCHSAQTVVFGDNRFEDLHERHVDKDDSPCAFCHNPHAPYDEGEGLISFAYGIENGWDIELIDGRSLSNAYWISEDGSQGFCYIRCHNKRHTPKDYERLGGSGTPTGIDDAPRLSMERIRAFPSPTTGSTTFRIVTSGSGDGTSSRAAIYDVAGRVVREFDLGVTVTGERLIQWDGRDSSGRMVSSGVYLFRVNAGRSHQSQKFVVLR